MSDTFVVFLAALPHPIGLGHDDKVTNTLSSLRSRPAYNGSGNLATENFGDDASADDVDALKAMNNSTIWFSHIRSDLRIFLCCVLCFVLM